MTNLKVTLYTYEYLLSGRCDKLEGPDGAYNFYEMELRQNIIIAQLSNIIDNLEQIKNNQYSLYEELQKSNYTIEQILNETRKMREASTLTAYHFWSGLFYLQSIFFYDTIKKKLTKQSIGTGEETAVYE